MALYNFFLNKLFEFLRWEECLENMPLKDGISMEFIKRQFPEMAKQTVSIIFFYYFLHYFIFCSINYNYYKLVNLLVTYCQAEEMAEEIRKEIEVEISRTNWMNRETKTLARNKLNLMEVLIGYPDWYNSSTDLSESYDGVKISLNFQ